MPTFSKVAEDLVLKLAKAKSFDRASARTITSPPAAVRLVNAGALDKATRKTKGGSQSTVYWLTATGQLMAKGLNGQRCRHCACSEFNACKGGCSWVKPDVCSNPKCVTAEVRRTEGRG